GIDACVFTGSTATGHKVRVRCAEHGIPASVEMGGKDAAIVLGDCDLERTAAGITHWALSNVGQACGAIEIALVEDAIADPFVSLMADAWRRLCVGPGEGECAELSPMAHPGQLEIVRRHVDEAVAAGAKLASGGAPTPTGSGLFYPPTLLDECSESMSVVRDETFGPVLAVVRVASAAEAVRVVNRGRYGLGASIWTRDIERAKRLARQLDVGVVDINNHAFTGACSSLPWSGTRDTGYSVANGPESLLTFTRPRTIVVDRSHHPESFWMPFDADMARVSGLLIDAQLMRLKKVWQLPILMRRRVATVRKFFSR
ncbi:MAG: aldehyde dehydrogenase family protein, partial [Polyangiaceae bacterium]|nr:aldehyde dehydrogenase family protein [Polyangiaceae bacterium]